MESLSTYSIKNLIHNDKEIEYSGSSMIIFGFLFKIFY